jgi:hypothetical protein
MHFLAPVHAACPVHLILDSLYLLKSTNYKVLHYVIYSNLMLNPSPRVRNITLGTVLANALKLCPLHLVREKFQTYAEPWVQF